MYHGLLKVYSFQGIKIFFIRVFIGLKKKKKNQSFLPSSEMLGWQSLRVPSRQNPGWWPPPLGVFSVTL